MPTARLEHVNISVTDGARTADLIARLTGWHRRWEGPSLDNGRSIHLGDETAYVAIHTSDARRSARFYAALGFRPWYDKLLERMEEFFKIPAGTALHNINMIMPDNPSIGRIEIAQYVGFPGSSQRDRAVPPNHGLLVASLETDDLAETEKLLHSIGTEPVGDRVEVDLPGVGPAYARTYFGPDDEVLEFYQRR